MLEADTFRKANRRIDDCFRGKTMSRAVLQAEDVADEVECADLAAAVREQLVTAHRAFHDLIHIFRGLCFAEDFSAAVVFELAQEELRAGQAAMLAEKLWPVRRIGVDVDKHGSSPCLNKTCLHPSGRSRRPYS